MIEPIGVFDSGVGGLTVAHALLERLPGARLIYFGDTAYAPYGPRPLTQIRQFALEICGFLAERGARAIVMGCNMSSAVALEAVREQLGIPAWGTIEAGAAAAAAASRTGRIGVAATEGTVQSSAYVEAVRRLWSEASVAQAACPELVPLIEAGTLDGDAGAVVAQSVRPLMAAGVDTLILGCTHYPLLRAEFQAAMGEHVAVVDPAEELAHQVARVRQGEAPGPVSLRRHELFASGPTDELVRQAELWLEGPFDGPYVVDVHERRSDAAPPV